MSQAKEEALELIRRLPDTVTTSDILDELYFKEQVDSGLRDVVDGRTISHEELKERLAQWRKSAWRWRQPQTCAADDWQSFRRRADYAPGAVYRHRRQGWEYTPIHPFADEPDLLRELGLEPEACRAADAWWCCGDDATLLESRVSDVGSGACGLFARRREGELRWVYLLLVVDQPYVTRDAFERAMDRLVELGFPGHARFQLRPRQGWVRVGDL
jgi:hypothetical protein